MPSIPAVSRPALTSVTPPHTQQCVGAGAEHQLLQIPGLGQVPCLRRHEDALPQTPYVVLDLLPID